MKKDKNEKFTGMTPLEKIEKGWFETNKNMTLIGYPISMLENIARVHHLIINENSYGHIVLSEFWVRD